MSNNDATIKLSTRRKGHMNKHERSEFIDDRFVSKGLLDHDRSISRERLIERTSGMTRTEIEAIAKDVEGTGKLLTGGVVSKHIRSIMKDDYKKTTRNISRKHATKAGNAVSSDNNDKKHKNTHNDKTKPENANKSIDHAQERNRIALAIVVDMSKKMKGMESPLALALLNCCKIASDKADCDVTIVSAGKELLFSDIRSTTSPAFSLQSKCKGKNDLVDAVLKTIKRCDNKWNDSNVCTSNGEAKYGSVRRTLIVVGDLSSVELDKKKTKKRLRKITKKIAEGWDIVSYDKLENDNDNAVDDVNKRTLPFGSCGMFTNGVELEHGLPEVVENILRSDD